MNICSSYKYYAWVDWCYTYSMLCFYVELQLLIVNKNKYRTWTYLKLPNFDLTWYKTDTMLYLFILFFDLVTLGFNIHIWFGVHAIEQILSWSVFFDFYHSIVGIACLFKLDTCVDCPFLGTTLMLHSILIQILCYLCLIYQSILPYWISFVSLIAELWLYLDTMNAILHALPIVCFNLGLCTRELLRLRAIISWSFELVGILSLLSILPCELRFYLDNNCTDTMLWLIGL